VSAVQLICFRRRRSRVRKVRDVRLDDGSKSAEAETASIRPICALFSDEPGTRLGTRLDRETGSQFLCRSIEDICPGSPSTSFAARGKFETGDHCDCNGPPSRALLGFTNQLIGQGGSQSWEAHSSCYGQTRNRIGPIRTWRCIIRTELRWRSTNRPSKLGIVDWGSRNGIV